MQAVLFDLDGTLTNTLQDIATAMNRALRRAGLPEFPVDAYRYLVGDGAKKLAERAVRDRQALRDAVLADYQAYYETHNRVATRPYAGIPELLAGLAARGYKLCVLSNKPHADTVNVVAHYFPQVDFALVRGQVESVPVKPDPTGALAVASALGIPPEEFFYLGDTAVDMRCARRAGMRPIGVLWGFREAQELLDAGAEQLIRAPEDMLAIAHQVTP